MSSAKSAARDAEADCHHFIVKNESTKYLCFTSCDKDSWILHVTTGIDVWRLAMDSSQLESHRDLADVTTNEAYFLRFSNAFRAGDITVTLQNHKVLLTVGSGPNALSYDLFEARADESKADLQRALFYFAEYSSNLKKKLTAKEEELALLKKQRTSTTDQGNILPDFEMKKQSGNQPKIVKQQGLSIVNPSSKKRKAAKGVEFD
ncbi:protein PAXX-like [Lytechinus variegatus]|uniref:protein PAXX-like n=1 Tax=Lytechinus variegatus TaxID=7654 RepID=UPI001BB28783|nr:protein PAXX-like [Lytechinus variegatus]